MAASTKGLLERGHPDAVLRASRVSRFSIKSPPTYISAIAAVALSTTIFLVLYYGVSHLAPNAAAAVAFFGLLLPAGLSALVAYRVFPLLGGTITLGRCAIVAVVDLGIVLAFTVVGAVIPWRAPDVWVWGLLSGTAFAASVNMLIYAATSDPRLPVAAVPSLALPAAALSVLSAAGALDPRQVLLGAYFVVVCLAASALWSRIVVAPFRRTFDENGLRLLQALLDAWAGWSKPKTGEGPSRGTLKMEEFFARHGQAREVGFRAAVFRRPGDEPLLWFVPDLHPGPYADLGGSDLPSKAAASFRGYAVSTFHGASTHDENPCGREELAKVTDSVIPAVERATEDGTATPSRRFSHGGTHVLAQSLGKHLVLVHSRAPASSDDIDWTVGRDVELRLAAEGAKGIALIDAHNCVGDDLGRTTEGSREHADLENAARLAVRGLATEPRGEFKVGFARRTLPADGAREFAVGRQGIAATVVEAGGQKTAYVLIDGNNLKAGLREAMLDALQGTVELAEVLTTDNHAVNTTMGADNEVGSRGDNTRLVDEVSAAVKQAVADLKFSAVTWASDRAQGVRVFGPGLTVKISSTINAAVAVMVPAYIACMSAALLGCAVLALAGV